MDQLFLWIKDGEGRRLVVTFEVASIIPARYAAKLMDPRFGVAYVGYGLDGPDAMFDLVRVMNGLNTRTKNATVG